MASLDIYKNEVALSASTADATGRAIQVSGCQVLTVSIIVSVSVASLVGTITFGATNSADRALDPTSVLPVNASGKLVTIAPANISFTPATGVVAFASPAIGTHELVVAFTDFGAWFRPTYDYTSGGGDVDLQVRIGAWSV